MATSSPAIWIVFLISTFLIIKEITSSSIVYATLVLSCILQFLCLLNIFGNSRINRELVVWKDAAEDIWANKLWLYSGQDILIILFSDSRVVSKNAKSRPDWKFVIGAMTSQLLEEYWKAEIWICILIRSLNLLLLGAYSRVLYKGSVERNNYSRSTPGNSISRPPQELELVKFVDILLANGNSGTEQKAYKKSRTAHPGKHGHNVGSTAFRNRAQGGDGSGEERTIQDDCGSPDTTVNSSVQITSPPPTPQTPPPPIPQTPPSPTPAPQVQPPTPAPQVQPPTPTLAPAPPPPPPPRGWFNFNFSGWFAFNFAGWFNFAVAGLAKIFLAISATLVLAPPQIAQSGGNSLSANDKTLLFGTKLFGLAGFIFCLLAYIIREDNLAAKLLIAFGVVSDIFGLLLIVALER